MKICVSLAEPSTEMCLAKLARVPFAEVRLDAMEQVSAAEVRRLFSVPCTTIATHRPGLRSIEARKELLLTAVEAGADYVDVELDTPWKYRDEIIERARFAGCKVIVSHHEMDMTPEQGELARILQECRAAGGDLTKIACRVNCPRDNARLLGLIQNEVNLVVVGMGPLGRITRIAAPLMGSPFTYASFNVGQETAPGQLDALTLHRHLTELQGA
jgi:3-dehydroquinate dehydratase type I